MYQQGLLTPEQEPLIPITPILYVPSKLGQQYFRCSNPQLMRRFKHGVFLQVFGSEKVNSTADNVRVNLRTVKRTMTQKT